MEELAQYMLLLAQPCTEECSAGTPHALLRETLQNPLSTVAAESRSHMAHLVSSVTTSLWTEFLVPYILHPDPADQAPHEEGLFLQRLQHPASAALWTLAEAGARRNDLAQRQRDAKKDQCKTHSGAIFRTDLEYYIWRPLGVEAGVLPDTATIFL